MRQICNLMFWVVFACVHSPAMAFEVAEERCSQGRCSTTFEAGFFDRYAPTNALDMVRNLPGFQLDDGDDGVRGFGGAAGNLLIDGERLSSKSEKPSDFLQRIPANQVQRVVLIRGQRGGLDLINQSVVANVIRNRDQVSGTWRVSSSQYTPDSRINPGVAGSLTGTLGGTQYNLGLEAGEYVGYIDRDEQVTNAANTLIEDRDEVWEEAGDFVDVSASLSRDFGEMAGDLNLSLGRWEEAGLERSLRQPVASDGFEILQGDSEGGTFWEVGFDLERQLAGHWQAKAIGLLRRSDYFEDAFLDRNEAATERISLFQTRFRSDNSESIARLELDFSGLEGHLIETSLEAAVNKLKSRFVLSQRENGALVRQVVPGAQTQVEEERLDWLLSDAFRLGPVSVDLAIGAERSVIEQTAQQGGGFNDSRTFFILKPSLLVTHAFSDQSQIRTGIRREASQLNFFEFVSSADLGDAELELGNPGLKPEKATTLDMVFEHRFAQRNGSISLTLFHSWIDDVEDVLPLQGVLEVPGNIGKGTQAGINLDLTLPLDRIGLPNARLDAEGQWQTSRVDDPLSGRSRKLSGRTPYRWEVTLRQDFPARRMAWLIKTFGSANAPQFGLDELGRRGERLDIDAFVELRITRALNVQFGLENLLRDGNARRRQVFEGPRTDGNLLFQEVREQRFAREFYVRISGAF